MFTVIWSRNDIQLVSEIHPDFYDATSVAFQRFTEFEKKFGITEVKVKDSRGQTLLRYNIKKIEADSP